MAVQIGAKPDSGFDDPLGLLKDCHRRIEHFLSLLALVAGTANHGTLSPEQQRVVETALGYFRVSAPRHTADEEESIFPRLRNDKTLPISTEVANLESQHSDVKLLHATVDQLFQQWLTEGQLDQQPQERLRAMLDRLQAVYTEHIHLEESVVFPLAAKLFNPDTLRLVGEEFRRRRA